MAFLLLACLTARTSHAQNRDVLCRDGDGEFQAEFSTGVKVRVAPARKDGLATRACEATLSWSDQSQVVATGASELDIDAFGVDFGVGGPVVTLQTKKSKADCCMEYDIYSLRAPPALLRRIMGGVYFSAADTDLDGRVEIWTADAAVDGFENLHIRDLDFAPPVVLRFARGRLLDASAEFRPYFDQKIADEQAKLSPRDLAEFKSSDGKLIAAGSAIPAARLIQLRSVKMKVLEIVWSYLYSGREQEAWRLLSEMWPASDFERIRAALTNERAHGIRAQVDGVSTPVRPGREGHAKIFDGTTFAAATPGLTPKNLESKPAITPPKAILMERPPPSTPLEIELSQSESELVLVIDSAGKVRSVEPLNSFQQPDEGLLKSTMNWKFIPAFSGSQPVASRILLGVSLRK